MIRKDVNYEELEGTIVNVTTEDAPCPKILIAHIDPEVGFTLVNADLTWERIVCLRREGIKGAVAAHPARFDLIFNVTTAAILRGSFDQRWINELLAIDKGLGVPPGYSFKDYSPSEDQCAFS